MCGVSYTVCLLIWVAKLETSHVLQGNKKKPIGVAMIAYQCPYFHSPFTLVQVTKITPRCNMELFSGRR